MKIPYRKCNRALKKEFGKGVVELRPCTWGSYPYVLAFREDNPSRRTMNRATEIVNQIIPTEWQWDAQRVTSARR